MHCQSKTQETNWKQVANLETTTAKIITTKIGIHISLKKQHTTNQKVEKWTNDTNRQFSDKEIWMDNRHMKKLFLTNNS